ncbi:CBF-domain-containing protein, partial [Ramicandelaber brevisporus]
GGSVKKSGEDDAAVIVANWTRERYLEFIRHLLVLLSSHPDAVVQVASLDVAMQMVQRESVAMSKSGNNGESEDGKFRYIFAHTLFCDVIDAVLAKPAVDEHATVNALLMRYINMYDDLRFYALKAIARHFSIQQNAAAVTTATTNGSTVKDTPKKRKNASDAIPAASSKHLPILHMAPHRRAFSDAWLAVLQTKLTPEMYKQVLLLLHKRIIPHMSSPIELMDFLTDSYNAGSISNNSSSSSSSSNSNNSSVISILALNGLFTLMQEYNLNYPDFYRKLYSLFNYQLLHVKYRSRFFRLADLFLSSTHIPSQLVAAFIKRMARLTLSAPPAGTIIVLALISNLLKRHPSCMVLIHRAPTISDDTGALDAMLMEDKFDFEAKDPLESSAMESSLWEIASLQDHYLHVVATLAKSFNEPFTKPPYVLEDFLDQTYATLHDAE